MGLKDSKLEGLLSGALLLILLAFALLASLLTYNSMLDDAFITFRYARHLAEGLGFGIWNPGEPAVEGFTSWAWMLAMAAAGWGDLSIPHASRVLGIGAHLGTVTLLFFAHRFIPEEAVDLPRDRIREAGRLGSLVAAASLPAAFYATSGMEAPLFCFAALLTGLLAVRSAGRFSTPALLAALLVMVVRPEGYVIALGAQLIAVWTARRRGESIRPHLLSAGIVLAAIGAVVVIRLSLFGHPLPNTYYAKATAGFANVHLGFQYLRDWFQRDPFPLIVLVAVAFEGVLSRRVSPLEGGLWLYLGFHIAYVLKVGGDPYAAFPYFRHLVHVLPLLALMMGLGVVRLLRERSRTARFALVLLAVVAANLNIAGLQGPLSVRLAQVEQQGLELSFREPQPAGMHRWLDSRLPAGTLIATGAAGKLPWFVADARVLDMLGLNDEHIAHHGRLKKGIIDSRQDVDYVLERRPDVIHSAIRADHLREGRPIERWSSYYREMWGRLIAKEIFLEEYLFILNLPSAHAFFIRRDFYDSLPPGHGIQVVPVMETSLVQDPS